MKNPPVLVTWLDAYLDLDAQGTPAELCVPSKEQEVQSIGFYLGMDPKNLYLGLDLGPADVRGLLRIPRGMILDIHVLGPLVSSTGKGASKSSRKGRSSSPSTSVTKKPSNGSSNSVEQRLAILDQTSPRPPSGDGAPTLSTKLPRFSGNGSRS